MTTHRIGLVGTGGIAPRHVEGCRRALGERGRIVAICDLRNDVVNAFGDTHRVGLRFTDPEVMMASGEIDVAVDITPPSARDTVLDAALKHGIHLLVEKPFTQSAARAITAVDEARSAGCIVAVNQNFRWFPEIRDTVEVLDSGKFGPVRFIQHDHFQNNPQKPGKWRAAEERFHIAHFGIHILDRIRWIARADPVSVSAVTARDANGSLLGEQSMSVIIQFEDGSIGQSTSTWLSKTLTGSFLRVDADHGSMKAQRSPTAHRGDAMWTAAPEAGDCIVREYRDDAAYPFSFGLSMLALLDGIDAKREPLNSGRDNIATMGIVDAAYISASRGGALTTIEEALGMPLAQARGLLPSEAISYASWPGGHPIKAPGKLSAD